MAQKKVSDVALRGNVGITPGNSRLTKSEGMRDLRPELLGSVQLVKTKETEAAYKRGFQDGFNSGISFGRVEAYREQAGTQKEERSPISERGSKTPDP